MNMYVGCREISQQKIFVDEGDMIMKGDGNRMDEEQQRYGRVLEE